MTEILALIHAHGQQFFGKFWFPVWTMVKLGFVLGPILGLIAYLTLWERKMIGWMHVRIGPDRTGPFGLLQPVADGIKLILKEIIVPEKADKKLFYLAPVLAMAPALAAWAVIPFGPEMVLADLNAGVLFFMTITSIGVYGVIVAG
ncbi:MAG: NADH-quinone oxidoreductase subunit H, partial [Oxalobacter sp.]|nr:NADH-quinone oxidoreductase subunit H [Oxalobacter sp.]